MNLRNIISSLLRTWLQNNSPWIITLFYGDFWKYRKGLTEKGISKDPRLYTEHLNRFNAYIGIKADIAKVPTFPHGLSGIFISNSAKLGGDIVIYQHVTIGSNTLTGSKNYGAPTIEDGVLIGAGAKIIGNVIIGKNSRIGAGCIVTRSIPANSVVVMQSPRIIVKEALINKFVANDGTLFKNM